MRVHDIIIRPLITEKAMTSGQKNVYVFEVNSAANKHQIKDAVEKLFKVEVSSVKTLIRKGKTKRVGRRMQTKSQPDTKKAYITVTKGTIDIVPTS